MRLLFIVIIVFVFVACSKKQNECVDAKDPEPISLNYESLSDELLGIESKEELIQFLDSNKILRDYFLHRADYPNDSVFLETLYQRFTNPHIDTLLMETEKVFGKEEKLKLDLVEAFGRVKAHYPDFTLPKIQTVVTGFDSDLFISDSLIIIGLDYYLGKGAKYRPNMYDYILQQYTPQNVVPSILLLIGIDTKLNANNPQDKTVLADMMAYGKSFYFAKQMSPCTPDSIFMHYTQAEMEGARKNIDLIWYRFVEDKVVYNTSTQLKQRFLGERPKTIEVGPECPGRIGQWIGWQIVNSYAKNNNVELVELMQESNAEKIFKESKFRAK